MSEFFEIEILHLGKYVIKLYNIVVFAIVLFSAVLLQFIFKKLIWRLKNIEQSKKYTVYKLFQYFFWIIIIITSLRVLDFNISLLLAGSAALLVGIGIGMQHIFSDFVSGIILLLDGTIKVGDIIEVNETIYKVKEIKVRTTIVIGRNENYIILPNSYLTENTVINWTYDQAKSRFKIDVGVDYSSDVDLVMKVLIKAASQHPKVLSEPEVFARFEDYGDSALIFSVFFWSEEVFRTERIKSEIRIAIFKAFKENNISIPFPQRVLHHKNPKDHNKD